MTKNENPFVSVVIPAFSSKRFDMTIDCVNSIFNNTYKNYEIILTVDGNEQLKQKMEDKFRCADKVTVIGNMQDEGPSMARNNCVKIAKGDIIAFIDDDAIAPTNWLELIVKDFSDYSNVIVVGGKLLPIYNSGRHESKKLPEELLWIVGCTYKGHAENKQYVRNVISANMAVKRDIFNYIKFESTYSKKNRLFVPIKQLEDTLFCTNVNNREYNTVLYDPCIIVRHNVPIERLKLGYIIKRSFSEGILKAQLEHIDHNKNGNRGENGNKKDNGNRGENGNKKDNGNRKENGNKNSDNNNILSHEQSYLNMLIASIIKNIYVFKIRDSLLLLTTVISVATGYMSEKILYTVKEKEDKKEDKNV